MRFAGCKWAVLTALVLNLFVTPQLLNSQELPSMPPKTGGDAGNAMARPGKHIRQVNIQGYTVMYHLLDLSERGEMMKVMEHHSVIGMSKSPDVTNHLMVYIQKPDGTPALGEVAYHVTGPDGKDFKTMAMGMYGGHGADIIMKLKGTYTIRAKVIFESGEAVSLEDEFTFPVK